MLGKERDLSHIIVTQKHIVFPALQSSHSSNLLKKHILLQVIRADSWSYNMQTIYYTFIKMSCYFAIVFIFLVLNVWRLFYFLKTQYLKKNKIKSVEVNRYLRNCNQVMFCFCKMERSLSALTNSALSRKLNSRKNACCMIYMRQNKNKTYLHCALKQMRFHSISGKSIQ